MIIYKVIDKSCATAYLTQEAYFKWIENGGYESEDEIFVFDINNVNELLEVNKKYAND